VIMLTITFKTKVKPEGTQRMRTMPLYQALATLRRQHANCILSGNEEWENRSKERFDELVRERLPSGSGWDNGSSLGITDGMEELPGKMKIRDSLVINGSFHHMDSYGGYAGWSEHTIPAEPQQAML
jgi:hypothetical protein